MLSTGVKQKEQVKVNRFGIDKQGRKVAAIIDIKEVKRIKEMIEGVSDLKAIHDRVAEPVEEYEVYNRKRKAHQRV